MADTHIIYGLHAIQVALKTHPELMLELWCDQQRHDARMQQLLTQAKGLGLKAQPADRDQLQKLAGNTRHQGVVARCKLPRTKSGSEQMLDDILEALNEPAFLLVLDGVQDPHNLGACLRSADGAGVHAVIAPKDRAVSLTGTVAKVASGAAHSVPFVQVTNLARTLRALQQRGIWLVGTDGEAEQSLYDVDLTGPLAIVMGAEGGGLRRLTRESCDYLVRLPMAGVVESLNVSVATGICLYEAVRQRGYANPAD
jgi:23S rRNA (guanosine2251-2'-O)-methyltransferase